MACSLIQTQQLSSDVFTETEAAATSGAGSVGNTQSGWTELSGATVQAVLDDIDDVLAARTVAPTAAGDLFTATAANAPALLAKGNALEVLRVNAGGTALEWAASTSANNDLLDGSVHQDTSAASPTRGDLIVADAAPKWGVLPLGGNWQIPRSDGSDLVFSADHQLNLAGIGDEEAQQLAVDTLTYSQSKVRIQAETGNTDDLTTITHTATLTDGDLLWITAYPGDTITLKAGGNIITNGDVVLTDQDYVMLIWDNGNSGWYLPSELYRQIFIQTDPLIEGMHVYEGASGEAEWIHSPKVTDWKKHFFFPIGTGAAANGCQQIVTGTAGTWATSTFTTNDGVHQVACGNNPGDGAGYNFADDGQGNVHDSDVKWVLEAWLYHDSDGSFQGSGFAYDVWFGISDTTFGFGVEEAIFYGSNPATGNQWDCRTTTGGTTTTTNSVGGVMGSWQRLKIVYDRGASTPTVYFYLNGSLAATHTTNLPVGNQMYFTWGFVTQDPNAMTNEVDYAGILHEPANV